METKNRYEGGPNYPIYFKDILDSILIDQRIRIELSRNKENNVVVPVLYHIESDKMIKDNEEFCDTYHVFYNPDKKENGKFIPANYIVRSYKGYKFIIYEDFVESVGYYVYHRNDLKYATWVLESKYSKNLNINKNVSSLKE